MVIAASTIAERVSTMNVRKKDASWAVKAAFILMARSVRNVTSLVLNVLGTIRVLNVLADDTAPHVRTNVTQQNVRHANVLQIIVQNVYVTRKPDTVCSDV